MDVCYGGANQQDDADDEDDNGGSSSTRPTALRHYATNPAFPARCPLRFHAAMLSV
jgi:hypothetical protein